MLIIRGIVPFPILTMIIIDTSGLIRVVSKDIKAHDIPHVHRIISLRFLPEIRRFIDLLLEEPLPTRSFALLRIVLPVRI